MKILKLAIHDLDLVDNKQGAIKSSNELIALPETEEGQYVKDYIAKHIEHSRTSKKTIPAKFKFATGRPEDNSVLNKLRQCFTINEEIGSELDDKIFLDQTILIAERIKTSMASTASMSDALIMFVYYELENSDKYIAIMKMDPKNAFTVGEEFNISVLKNVLPDENGKLHKIAIIRVVDHTEIEDGKDCPVFSKNPSLFVLDQQNTITKEQSFFMESFLNAEALFTEPGMTSLIFKKSFNFLSDKGYIAKENQLDFETKLRNYLSTHTTFSLSDSLYEVTLEYITDESKKDLDVFTSQVSKPLLEEIVDKHYADATMSFDTDDRDIKSLKFVNDDKTVRFIISNKVNYRENVSIENDAENDVVVIKLKNGLGNGIIKTEEP